MAVVHLTHRYAHGEVEEECARWVGSVVTVVEPWYLPSHERVAGCPSIEHCVEPRHYDAHMYKSRSQVNSWSSPRTVPPSSVRLSHKFSTHCTLL